MRKTQNKDIIGKALLSLIFLLVGEGLLGMSLFWPVLLSLVISTKKSYWVGLFLGIIFSAMTGSVLGLASLLIVVFLFIFEKWRGILRDNIWLTGLAVVLFGFVTDKILGLSWSPLEGVTIFGLTWLVAKLEYFSND